MRQLTRLMLLTLPLGAGCHSADKPRLIDRLFHHDEDCPSSRAASRVPGVCEAQVAPFAAPVGLRGMGTPIALAPLTATPPDDGAGFAQPQATRPDELPPPGSRIPPQLVPGGVA